jgi:putative DNA methylase
MNVKTKKKLIEVALPLEAINAASAREKNIRHRHPSTLHLWWARRPLAAARAVIFAQMVDDPSEYVETILSIPETRQAAEREWKKRRELWASKPEDGQRGPEPTLSECAADIERQRLFDVIEELVQWENTTNEAVLRKARDEIWQSWRRACADNADHPRARELFDRQKLPAFHDPFAGGGALPLEAQRLGLEAFASDLNPVAVLICKAMIEIPPKFAGRPPVNPKWANRPAAEKALRVWKGAEGLAEDVRYYGRWMRDEAEKRIGHLYPKVEITGEMARERPDLKPLVGQQLTVIAWLWARTVKSPNPAFAKVDVPLASTFMLSTKAGKEAYVEPVIEDGGYRFTVKVGKPRDAESTKRGTKSGGSHSSFLCLISGTPMPFDYIRDEGKAGRLGARLMAIVADSGRGRIFLAPTEEMASVAAAASPDWSPDFEMPTNPFSVRPPLYGLNTYADLFTRRQLVALTTFSDLIGEAVQQARRHALTSSLSDDRTLLRDGGTGATAYTETVEMFLGIALSRLVDIQNSLCGWENTKTQVRHLFTRQAIPMLWDFGENNVFGGAAGDYLISLENMVKALECLPSASPGHAAQYDAQSQTTSTDKLVSTDPPYYNNVDYADLSDFFYVWLRRSLSTIFPDLFATVATPKTNELVATPYRHGGKEKAETFFLNGMTNTMHRLAEQTHPAFPVTIYYAFKQSETGNTGGTANTGWETFLDAVIRAGFAISGTWPIRTESAIRMMGQTMNALASSIVLLCRRRATNAPTATRREFVAALKAELPAALRHLQAGNIAPVDLAQAAIGPGMAVYTRYAKVLDAEGKPVSVRESLALINATLDEVLAEQEGDFDADSRWALAWFEQQGFAEGEYGIAEVLSKAKVTTVAHLADAKIVDSSRGKVRLLKPEELQPNWDPVIRSGLPAWEIVHQLIRALGAGGENAAADLVAKLGARAEIARELAYRLYTVCERKKRAAEALAYNSLVQSWPEIARLAREGVTRQPTQGGLFEATEA